MTERRFTGHRPVPRTPPNPQKEDIMEPQITPQSFCYWLQGALELAETQGYELGAAQVQTITEKLNLVFVHEIKPSFPINPHSSHDMQIKC